MILVVAGLIRFEVSGLGDTPRNTLARCICLLRSYGRNPRAFQKCVRVGTHPERRHQVFEHGTGPREEDGTPMIEGVGSAQQEPAFLGNIFLGNGSKYSDTGLSGEQIVTGGMQLLRLNIVP